MENDIKPEKRKMKSRSEEGFSQSIREVGTISGRNKGKRRSENIISLEEVLSAERSGNEDKDTKEKDQVSPIEKNNID